MFQLRQPTRRGWHLIGVIEFRFSLIEQPLTVCVVLWPNVPISVKGGGRGKGPEAAGLIKSNADRFAWWQRNQLAQSAMWNSICHVEHVGIVVGEERNLMFVFVVEISFFLLNLKTRVRGRIVFILRVPNDILPNWDLAIPLNI